MITNINPKMYVFSGNNGSGNTRYRQAIWDQLGVSVNLDPDALARKYGTEKDMKAGKEAIRLIGECISTKTSFTMETTLSSKLSLKQIKEAKRVGLR